MSKICEHCERQAIPGLRFCGTHEAQVRKAMAASGYLEPISDKTHSMFDPYRKVGVQNPLRVQPTR